MTEEKLVELFWARDEAAVAQAQAQYGAWAGTIASRLLDSPEDAEECVNTCWFKVWNAIPPARPVHFKGWLGAVVRNEALAMLKKRERLPKQVEEAALELAAVVGETDPVAARAESAELGRAISEFLRAQRREVRVAFLRRYWYADSVEEVARRMGWGLSKTKSVLFRTRRKLRNYLEKEGLWHG